MLQTTTDYIEGFTYLTQGTGTAALSYFPMPEGRVLNNGGMLTQEFVIADQQGNARLSFQDNGNGIPVVKQENSYYAFGLIMPNSPVATPTTPNKKLYNGGSEWQNDFGNLPDYYQTFNRNYDAATGRFVGVDPMAESAESTTTYNYAGNNPVMFNDPMGDITAEQWANAIEYAYSTGNENRYYQDNGSNSSNVIATSGAFYGQDSPGPGPQASNGGGGAGGSAPLYSVLSNNDAFTMVTAYIDKFNAWGINGTPSSYEIAAGEYNHQLPAGSAKVNSRSYAGWIVLGNYYKTDANGNSETINGVSGSFESRQVTQAANQGGEGDEWTHTANNLIGSFGVGWGAKENLLDFAAKASPEIEELGYFKAVKIGSKGLLAAQVVVSGAQALNAWSHSDRNWRTNDGNKWGVTGKAALDITMGAIGTFGGPIGWGISGVYFVGDAFGVWGDWGEAPKH